MIIGTSYCTLLFGNSEEKSPKLFFLIWGEFTVMIEDSTGCLLTFCAIDFYFSFTRILKHPILFFVRKKTTNNYSKDHNGADCTNITWRKYFSNSFLHLTGLSVLYIFVSFCKSLVYRRSKSQWGGEAKVFDHLRQGPTQQDV